MKQGITCGSGAVSCLRLAFKPAMLAIAAVAILGCPTTPTTPAGPEISVVPAAFNFGTSLTADSFTVTNAGDGILVWQVGATPSWLDVSPVAGSTPVGGPTTVSMTVNRTGLAAGTYQEQFLVASNGGSRVISVTIQVSSAPVAPTLQVTPTSLDFGTAATTLPLSVANAGQGTVNWTINTAALPSWLTVSTSSGATSTTATTVNVTALRSGLSAGTYTSNINFTSNGGNVAVPVTMTVPGPSPHLSITPTTLSFGTNTTELQLSIANTGTGTLNWNLAESLSWLTLSSATGTTTSETDVVTVTVNRTGLSAAAYTGAISVTSDGGTATIDVSMTVANPQLVVTPTTLNFGTHALNKLFALSNAGTGTITWSINTAGFPTWLTVGTTSGTVSTTAQSVLATVNRTGISPGNYSHTFTVTSDAGNVNVTAYMSVATQPTLSVDTGGASYGTQPLAALGDEDTTFVFTITNSGTGTLNWSIDPADFEDWLTMTPVQGSITGSEPNYVTITVNRLGLSTNPYYDDVPIVSNGGTVILHVTMVVPPRPVIGVTPETIDFGLTDNTSLFSVANIGDPGTILSFLVVSGSPNWLFNSPSTGVSIGTESVIKDYKDISVSIDRSNIDGISSVSTFTVYALNAEGEIDTQIEPATVDVSVQANPLSFQLGLARTRIPSMVRWDFLMRDFRNSTFFMAPEDLDGAFSIFEDGIRIEEPAETTQRVLLQNSNLTSSTSDYRTDLRTTVMLLLDYSGSMETWAQGLATPTTIEAIQNQVASTFINDYFDNLSNVERGFAKLGIMEFHDRSTSANVVMAPTTDRAALLTALGAISITDHGATALLPAIEAATAQLVLSDGALIPFDNSDIRAVALLSDGRLTTPPGKIQDTIDYMVACDTRFLGIGWGGQVNHEPLARLATGTGGHYYLSKLNADDTPNVTNFDNNAVLCADDMASHMVLRYITLNEGDNVPVRFDGAFDNPNDSPDQGILQGTFKEQDIKLGAVVGDILLGQISMRSTGVVAGGTQVTLRAEYVPRNVSQFKFRVTPTGYTILPATLAQGGITEGWTLATAAGPAGTYTLTAPSGTVLPYGSAGDLVKLTFAAAPASVALSVDNSIYTGAEAKYFISPDSLDIAAIPSLAPAFPTPYISPASIDFGTTLNSATFTVRNIGGSLFYGTTDIALHWSTEDLPFFVQSVTPESGVRSTTVGVDTALVRVDRTINAGTYTGSLTISYTTGDLGLNGSTTIPMSIQVLPPVLTTSPSPLTITFPGVSLSGGTLTQTFSITNTGQSTLAWTIDNTGLPSWVSVLSPISDSTTTETDTVTVTVDPSEVSTTGTYTWTSDILSDGGTVPLTITMVVTGP